MTTWKNEILNNQIDKDPQEIFNAYCSAIGDYFVENNFKYIKSRPRIERRYEDIIQTINFWSSKTNEINNSVNLEILPYIKSKSLKKWIKLNSVGRNEFIYAVKVKSPRNFNVFGHNYSDFVELTKEIDNIIIRELNRFRDGLKDLDYFFKTDEFNNGIIADNFMAFICKSNPEYIDMGINKLGNKISESQMIKINEIKNAS